MKNQYIGDIGDYGKYGLLRFLSENGIIIGVNWYLSKYDKTTDGNKNDYLNDDRENGYSCYDPKLFDLLKKYAFNRNKKVEQLEQNNVVPNAVYYNNMLKTVSDVSIKDRRTVRDNWHSEALKKLNGANLIFADPDNGSADDKYIYRKKGEKFVGVKELAEYYNNGKDVVYYCHKARRSQNAWEKKMVELKAVCPDVETIVLTFHRGTQRSYIFGIHPNNYEKYKKLIKAFLATKWGTVNVDEKQIPFSLEYPKADEL